MFARIMAVMLAVILVTTVSLSAVWWFTLRNQQIDMRLDYLATEAFNIAYMAENLSGDTLMNSNSEADKMLWMQITNIADKVNEEYGAYIAVIDRAGYGMTNANALNGDPESEKIRNAEELQEALQHAMQGTAILIHSEEGSDPTFTVGAPWMRGNDVAGAVLIRTKAVRIESGLSEIFWKIVLLATVVFVLSGVVMFLFVRSRLKPLQQLGTAAGRIAEGDFSVQVDEKAGDRELREVSSAFNTMTRKLQGVEEGRREFVANVSHELRSPITSIRGFAEGMADGVIPAEEHPKYLRLVANESKRLSGLIEDLLALSRLERDDVQLNLTVFDINEMLRRAVIRRMNDLDRKKIDVSCEFMEDTCPVRADSDRIEQVVINLLDNAIKFTPEGGSIQLESSAKDKIVEITVRDSGSGVPPEDRDKVFDRFFTADRAHTAGKGTGLGLSISKRIMEMHGQNIRLLDTEEGAAFQFTLEKG